MKPQLLFFLVLALLAGCKSAETDSTPDRLTNIVIIFTDDQGYQDLGCYGSPDILTPNIDKMAQNGVRFTQFYAAQGVCSASRAALLTGCYPNRIGVNGAFMPEATQALNLDETTIAEMLKPLGYATAIFGKWHLGSHPDYLPTRQGFDEYFGIPYSNDMWPRHPSQGTIFHFPPLPLYDGETIIETLEDQSMLTTQITEHAVDFIHRHKDQPFFLYVPQPQPHVPLFVSDKFKGKSERGLYGDVIMEIDWSVGQILAALAEDGLAENTLVIYASDNGPWLSYGDHSGEAIPLREGKGTAWEGGVRVPGIMKWPGKIPPAYTYEGPVMAIDVLPTIAAITGAPLPPRSIDGKNILPILENEAGAQNPHEAYYFYYNTNELHAVLQHPWKLYLPHRYRSLNGRPGGTGGMPVEYDMNDMGMELYNLADDIEEQHNVLDAYPEIVDSLLNLAEKARSRMGDKLTDRKGSDVREAGVVPPIGGE
jgi:arylsulfatase